MNGSCPDGYGPWRLSLSTSRRLISLDRALAERDAEDYINYAAIMARGVGSVGLSAICGRLAMPLMIAGTLGLLGVALASPTAPQIPLLKSPDASTPENNPRISVMIVGDSITQGAEGDWTWRYRIWEWFRDQNVKVCD